jgi:hypothetical protein
MATTKPTPDPVALARALERSVYRITDDDPDPDGDLKRFHSLERRLHQALKRGGHAAVVVGDKLVVDTRQTFNVDPDGCGRFEVLDLSKIRGLATAGANGHADAPAGGAEAVTPAAEFRTLLAAWREATAEYRRCVIATAEAAKAVPLITEPASHADRAEALAVQLRAEETQTAAGSERWGLEEQLLALVLQSHGFTPPTVTMTDAWLPWPPLAVVIDGTTLIAYPDPNDSGDAFFTILEPANVLTLS